MILALDIGNSNIVLGCIDDTGIYNIFRMATDLSKTMNEFAVDIKALLDFEDVSISSFEGAIISSVVPQLTSVLSDAVKYLTGNSPIVVSAGIKTGVNIQIDNPAEAGSDLVVAASAAIKLYTPPIIVIDMGTATTLTAIDKTGSFLGGAIIPGVELSLNALTGKTSMLPHVAIEPPKYCIGKNTADCMRSGIVFGTVSMIDGMLDRIVSEMNCDKVFIVATGGLARSIIPMCRHEILINDNLLLQGLYIIYKKNEKKSRLS